MSVSVHISDNGYEPLSDNGRKSRNWRRLWNRLSRFQRNMIWLVVCVALVLLVYVALDDNGETPLVRQNHDRQSKQHQKPPVEESQGNPAGNQLEEDVVGDGWKADLQKIEAAMDEADEQERRQGNRVEETFKFDATTINKRQQAVIDAFQHAWKGYKKCAWGNDHVKPITCRHHNWFHLGLTIVDALDTMIIMGLKEEFEESREWVKKLSFDVDLDVNLFEVTIRVLGGLLSAYHLTADRMFLDKAIDLGERLLPSFRTLSGVPYSDINLASREAHSPKWSPDSSTSEVTTIQLEFRDLSRSSGRPEFEEAAENVSQHVHSLEKTEGLVPIFINANSGKLRSYATITVGARGDSYYEYLLKQWIQTGKKVNYYRDDYIEGIKGIKKLLARRTVPNGLLFIGELLGGGKDFKPKMDHLTCYLPGTLALGVHNGMPKDHMDLAYDLLNTCYQTYATQPTFLAPEITYFQMEGEGGNDMYVKTNDAHNLLRPEFLESLWYMYSLTGNTTYQEWGWRIFQAFEEHTRFEHGYSSIGNVKSLTNKRPRDIMESFFLSETLKYLFLLFSDNRKLVDVDRYVVNTEAHPLPIYTS